MRFSYWVNIAWGMKKDFVTFPIKKSCLFLDFLKLLWDYTLR